MLARAGAANEGGNIESLQVIVGSILSTTTVLLIAGFIAREAFKRVLDARLDQFRHELRLDETTRQLMLKSQIEHKERQLSELYGPIYAMLKRGRILARLLREAKLERINEQFWVLAYRTNDEIEKRLLGNSHLIDGGEMPEAHVQFLTHVALWRAFGEATRASPPPQHELPEAWYSEAFEREIYET